MRLIPSRTPRPPMPSVAAPKRRAHTFGTAIADDRILRWVCAILAATIFEGGARKWILTPWLQPAAFIAKDALALAFMVAYPLPLRPGTAKWLRDLSIALMVLLLPSFLVGLSATAQSSLVSYKNAVLWPLFAAHLAVRTELRVFSRLTSRLVIISCGVAALGLAQYNSSPQSWLNRDAWTAAGLQSRAAILGTGVRASGTFSFITGMTTFSMFLFGFSLWRLLDTSRRGERINAAVGIIAATICGVTSGSRSSIAVFAATIVLVLAVSMRARFFFRLVPVAAAGVLASVYLLPDVTASFIQRWQNAGDSTIARATGQATRGNLLSIAGDHPFGVGLGQRTGYGVAAEQLGTGQAGQAGYDDGSSNAVLEAGLPGLLGLGLTIFVSLQLILRALRSRSREFRMTGACLGVVPLYFLASGRWYDHVGTAFFWFCVAIWLSTDPKLVAIRERLSQPRKSDRWPLLGGGPHGERAKMGGAVPL